MALFLEYILIHTGRKPDANFFFPLIYISANVQVQEAKQALELMHKWETIDVSDALELLSPVFESEEVIPLIKEKVNILHSLP